MYKLVGSPKTRAFRVMWAFEELGLDYELDPAGPQSDSAREASTKGKVPVLIEGDFVLEDSTAILTYLADKHGDLTYPAGSQARARQDALTFSILDELEGALWTASRHSFVLPQERRVPAIKDSLRWEFERDIKNLDSAMIGPFVAGDRFTIADIIATHNLGWAFGIGFEIGSEKLLAYSKEMRSRDGFQRAKAKAS